MARLHGVCDLADARVMGKYTAADSTREERDPHPTMYPISLCAIRGCQMVGTVSSLSMAADTEFFLFFSFLFSLFILGVLPMRHGCGCLYP
jgi:hypothetical protein